MLNALLCLFFCFCFFKLLMLCYEQYERVDLPHDVEAALPLSFSGPIALPPLKTWMKKSFGALTVMLQTRTLRK